MADNAIFCKNFHKTLGIWKKIRIFATCNILNGIFSGQDFLRYRLQTYF